MKLTREELLMKLGAARARAPLAWRLIDITVDSRHIRRSSARPHRNLTIIT
jgi:hypothetical protein